MKVTVNDTYKNKTIEPENGYVLSEWDRQDILNYSSYHKMTAPLNYDESKLYEITVEEDERYILQQREVIEKQREAYEKEEAKRR